MSQQNIQSQGDPTQSITQQPEQQVTTTSDVPATNQVVPSISQGNEQLEQSATQPVATTVSPTPVEVQNNQSQGGPTLQEQPSSTPPPADSQQQLQQVTPSNIQQTAGQGQEQALVNTSNSLNPEAQPASVNLAQAQSQVNNSAQDQNKVSQGQAIQSQGGQIENNQSVPQDNPAGENGQMQTNQQQAGGIQRYVPFMNKIKPRAGQGLGQTGATIPQHISNTLIEVVKTGDIEKFTQEYRKFGIEVRDVITDMAKFKQNLIFAAIQIQGEDQAIEMIKYLCELGVDVTQMDNLKQSPLYYTCRDGKIKLCQFLIEQGVNVNLIDIYGQNAIYYATNLGHIEVVRLLKYYGSDHDYKDENGQTPVYYALKSNRADVLEQLLQYGCNLQIVDNRGHSPMNIAMRNKSSHLKDMLVKYGAQLPRDKHEKEKKPDNKKITAPTGIPPARRINEKLIPKEFVLQIFDGEQYRPITQYEFEKFSKSHPELSKFFTDEKEIEKLHTPLVDESVPIYHHWERVASRMMSILMRKHESWIFLEPVDAIKLGIPDYFRIIQKPMDLGTAKENLRKHEYKSMQQFIDDVQLVFSNCLAYNGENSQVGQMCSKVKEEFWIQYEQLNVEFYLCENIFK